MFVHNYGDEGPLVLLLHGIPGSAAIWIPVADRLARTHRVLVPDLIGFGRSPRTDRIEELWADAQAHAVADVLTEPAVVVGHDFGGPVALSLFSERPDLVRRLVLVATNGFADTPIPLPIRAVTWPFVGGVAARLLMSGPGLRMVAAGHADVGDAAQVRATRTIFSSALRQLSTRYAPIQGTLPRIDVPATVVWGENDPFFALSEGWRLAAAIPGARFQSLPGAGHFLPSERPAELAAVIAG